MSDVFMKSEYKYSNALANSEKFEIKYFFVVTHNFDSFKSRPASYSYTEIEWIKFHRLSWI